MLVHTTVLTDRHQFECFRKLTSTRRFFSDFELHVDAEQRPWAFKKIGDRLLAFCLLGPGWVFEPEAQARRREDYAARCNSMMEVASQPELQRERLEKIAKGFRLGDIAFRILVAIHSLVLVQRRSVIRIPDKLLAKLVWGQKAPPEHWRKTVVDVLDSLSWIHILPASKELTDLGRNSALIAWARDLRSSKSDVCNDLCPGFPAKHSHFQVSIGKGFLGVLEQFADGDSSLRSYDFKLTGKKSDGPSLRQIGRGGALATSYIPAILGQPEACSRLTVRQRQLLQTIVRETTRITKKSRRDLSEAEVYKTTSVPGKSRKMVPCSHLDSIAPFVGFNGNNKLKGKGYGLLTKGGWLRKTGYSIEELGEFLEDLSTLCRELDLVAIGFHYRDEVFYDLAQLLRWAATSSGRKKLQRIHLRLYSSKDYLSRWNQFFGWSPVPDEVGESEDSTDELLRRLKETTTNRKDLAQGIGLDPSFLSKILKGKKSWPSGKDRQALEWLAAQRGDQSPNTHAATRLTGFIEGFDPQSCSILDVALAYRELGWAVVPQLPGEKHPCVKWKPYQERIPTVEEISGWFSRWPQAGLAVVLGKVSDLFVVDVDGTEAHNELLKRIPTLPSCPKVVSGSQAKHRYHLYFKCPENPTKAKSTPWHPKLEFRGERGIIICPPSLHPSGNRYCWEIEPSDLSPPQLPSQILKALSDSRRMPDPSQPGSTSSTCDLDVASSTADFLSGKHAEGPNWNQQLFQAACDLAGRGYRQERATALLLAGARPWNEGEAEVVRQTIDSAFSQPRSPSQR